MREGTRFIGMPAASTRASNEKIGNRGGLALFLFVAIVAVVVPLFAYVYTRM